MRGNSFIGRSPHIKEHDFELHANVYVLAEKYEIPGLKPAALQHCKSAAELTIDVRNPNFTASIMIAYTETLEEDRGLRDAIVRALDNNLQTLKKPIRSLLKQFPDLAYDWLTYKYRSRKPEGSIGRAGTIDSHSLLPYRSVRHDWVAGLQRSIGVRS